MLSGRGNGAGFFQENKKEVIWVMGEDYVIRMEVSGKTAMWARPDTGATPVSYPVPPWSAAKGLFESIIRL